MCKTASRSDKFEGLSNVFVPYDFTHEQLLLSFYKFMSLN